jgi:hypothetical protein
MRWVTKNLISRAPPCFGRPIKPLVPVAFVVVSTHQSALGPRGELSYVYHKEGLCPSSEDINRLMMMILGIGPDSIQLDTVCCTLFVFVRPSYIIAQ